MDDIKNNQRTRYPRLYHDTYWGNYKISQSTGDVTIIENRNRFATQYDLYSRISKIPMKHQKEAGVYTQEVLKDANEMKFHDKWSFLIQKDERKRHIEYYKTVDNNIIAIFSPYDTSERMTDMAVECGYSLIDPLYSHAANTFVKEIEN
jgi:hypothetical protein|tara:strand:+ start:18 stop:464 length:447 start_codon:yes stop_codon:yes gene_type:complete